MVAPAKLPKLHAKSRVGSHLLDVTLPVALVMGAVGVVAGVMLHDRILAMGGGQKPGAAGTDAAHVHNGGAGLAGTRVAAAAGQEQDIVRYHCTMHNPPYEQNGPGNCPICGMILTVFHTHPTEVGTVSIDPAVVQNMGVRTAMPVKSVLKQEIRAVGTLTEPEENHRDINLRVSGWIQKLYANQEGMPVNAGDPLFELYSPEVTAAADELIAARKSSENMNAADRALLGKSTDALLAAARRRLELMGIAGEQIAAIEKMDKAPATVAFSSPIHGHVAAKMVIEGSAVKAGEPLMRIADRSKMWMIVQVFEQQLGAVKSGAKVHATVTAFPGKDFEGTVDFVYPHLDPSTRTASVRVLLPNASHDLHENMFAQAVIEAEGKGEAGVLVPREAVIDSGTRQIVYVSLGGGKFAAREVKVGAAGILKNAGDSLADPADAFSGSQYVEIISGLTEQETVVTSGQFLLDSESRLEEARRKLSTPPPMPVPAATEPVTK